MIGQACIIMYANSQDNEQLQMLFKWKSVIILCTPQTEQSRDNLFLKTQFDYIFKSNQESISPVFDSLSPSQDFCHVGAGLPGLNQY